MRFLKITQKAAGSIRFHPTEYMFGGGGVCYARRTK